VIRRLVALCAVAFVVAGFVLADDEPAPRLKKKARPGDENAPKKEEPTPKEKTKEKPSQPPRLPDRPKVDDDPDIPPPEQEIDEQEVLGRVSKNMRAAEERLDNKDLGEGTRQMQRDVVKGLDDLIRQSQNGGQQGQEDQQEDQGGASQDQQKQRQRRAQQAKGSPGQRKNQRGMQNQRAQREARRAQKRGQQPRAQGQPRPGNQQEQDQGQQEAGANPGAGNGGPQGEPNKIADVYKDIWGHLPETLRAEMDAYGREKFMAKYEELIKRYYDRAARESRRKGD